MTTGDKIKFYRKKLNLTQTELGKKLGVKKMQSANGNVVVLMTFHAQK